MCLVGQYYYFQCFLPPKSFCFGGVCLPACTFPVHWVDLHCLLRWVMRGLSESLPGKHLTRKKLPLRAYSLELQPIPGNLVVT